MHNIKFTLAVQFSGIKYTDNMVEPWLLSIQNFFIAPNRNAMPSKH